ncbi:carbohydrate kinase [Methanolobus sp. ZRKC2]|uniref:carbohydrate kinase family protein n=1 Tax=Methanolobus sp. ZRKC2 TaxID=3125783 RepID=UPI00325185CD
MSRVFSISETFLDILFKDGKVLSSCPGGSMLNSSVSLGRTGTDVFLLTEFADDDIGNMICSFLKENRVSTEYLSIYSGRKSPLSLAFLDHVNDASYSFYEDFPEKRTLKAVDDLKPDDIIIFGSILAISNEIRFELTRLLDEAKRAGLAIIYDPNFRPSHVQSHEVTKMVRENIGYSSIVRASDEDMMNIEGISNADDAYEYVCNNGCKCLVYTAGTNGVHLRTPSVSKYYAAHEISAVSTIGAGDSFTAGITYQLIREGILPGSTDTIPEPVWDRIIGKGIDFASEVCRGNENYISKSFAAGMEKIEDNS